MPLSSGNQCFVSGFRWAQHKLNIRGQFDSPAPMPGTVDLSSWAQSFVTRSGTKASAGPVHSAPPSYAASAHQVKAIMKSGRGLDAAIGPQYTDPLSGALRLAKASASSG